MKQSSLFCCVSITITGVFHHIMWHFSDHKLLLVLLIFVELSKCQRCDVTLSGPKRKTKCVFPFRFNGTVYNHCTDAGEPGKYWCSTKTYQDGTHVGGQGQWGYCHPRCKVPETNPSALGDYLPTAKAGTCGFPASVGLIKGGLDTKRGELAFMAALGYKASSNANMTYNCGGSLINRRYVLTAAHCHNPRNPAMQIKEVVLGEHKLGVDPDCIGCAPIQKFKIKPEDVTLHENWNTNYVMSNGNDIALVKLPEPVITIREDPTSIVLPICLKWNSNLRMPSKEHLVAGWGRRNNDFTDRGDTATVGAFSTVLQKLQVPFFNGETCKREYRAYSLINPSKVVCAGGIAGMRKIKMQLTTTHMFIFLNYTLQL